MFTEGRTGVFLWCVISWFYFSWNVNLGNYSSWLLTWRFCVAHEEPELLTDIRDFTTLFYVILRHKFSEWLELSMESDLRFAIWSLDLTICDFAFLKHCFCCKNRLLKEYLTCLFLWFGKTKFLFLLTVILNFIHLWTVPERPPVWPSSQ